MRGHTVGVYFSGTRFVEEGRSLESLDLIRSPALLDVVKSLALFDVKKVVGFPSVLKSVEFQKSGVSK